MDGQCTSPVVSMLPLNALNHPEIRTAGAKLRLHFAFNSALNTGLNGLYRSTFTNDAGNQVSIVTTQFEATYARRAFPCFDEPAYKANFSLTVDGIPPSYTALGNMPPVSNATNADGTYTVTFGTTPRMSTYLLAFVTAPMVSVTTTAGVHNVTVSVYAVARADNAYKIAYALDSSARVLDYFEATFDLAFPLPKIDMVAIPDFAAGAMESTCTARCAAPRVACCSAHARDDVPVRACVQTGASSRTAKRRCWAMRPSPPPPSCSASRWW
ncbi:hypothetical protein EON66_04260 [archaeon]|nr:MAG: hypothetical protein EON66_04260 [archaeon]